MDTNLYKPADVAQILRISKALVYRLCAEGVIPSIRFGRTVRIQSKALDDFVNKYTVNDKNVSSHIS